MFDKLLGRELEPPYTPGPWRCRPWWSGYFEVERITMTSGNLSLQTFFLGNRLVYIYTYIYIHAIYILCYIYIYIYIIYYIYNIYYIYYIYICYISEKSLTFFFVRHLPAEIRRSLLWLGFPVRARPPTDQKRPHGYSKARRGTCCDRIHNPSYRDYMRLISMEKIYEIIYNLSILISDISELSGNWMYNKKCFRFVFRFFFALFRFPGSSPGMPPGTVRALWASLLQRWHDENDPGMLDFNGFHHDSNLVGGLEPWY